MLTGGSPSRRPPAWASSAIGSIALPGCASASEVCFAFASTLRAKTACSASAAAILRARKSKCAGTYKPLGCRGGTPGRKKLLSGSGRFCRPLPPSSPSATSPGGARTAAGLRDGLPRAGIRPHLASPSSAREVRSSLYRPASPLFCNRLYNAVTTPYRVRKSTGRRSTDTLKNGHAGFWSDRAG